MKNDRTSFAVERRHSGVWRVIPIALFELGLAASSFAIDKSWNAGNGSWNSAGNWSPNGVPGANDTARIGNLPGVQNAIVSAAGAPFVPEAIEISDGMTLDAAGVEFVGFDLLVTISGGDSRFIVRPHVGINQYDFIGEIHVGPGSHLELKDNVPIRLFWESHSWGRIEGWGEIQVNSPTPFSNTGVINPGTGGLRFEQIWSGELAPFDLDGSGEFGQVWLNVPFSTLEITASGLADPFDGVVNMSPGALLTMNMADGWQVDPGGVINASGGIANAAAQINGDDLTIAGSVHVGNEGILRILADAVVETQAGTSVFTDSRLEFDGATIVNGGAFHLYSGATLDFDGQTTMRGGHFSTQSTDPADGSVNFNATTTWNGSGGPVEITGVARQMGNGFVNGPTVINADVFDMDGDGDTAWTIWNDLVINADSLQPDDTDTFAGTITVANGTVGRLTVHVEPLLADFQMAGEMNLIGHPSVFGTRYAGDTLDLLGEINVSGKVAFGAYLRALDGQIDIGAENAVMRLDGGGLITSGCTFSGDGEFRIGPTGSPLLVEANLNGVGLVNQGYLRVAYAASVDRFASEAGSSWMVSLRGHDAGVSYDQLRVTHGGATLAGALEAEFLDADLLPGGDPFMPVIGDEFTILRAAGSVTGTFAESPSTISQGHRYDWAVLYGDHDVRLRLDAIIECALGDLDDDGDVDLQDLAILLAHFGTISGAEWSIGDLDNDDDVDLQDLALLLANFGASCD